MKLRQMVGVLLMGSAIAVASPVRADIYRSPYPTTGAELKALALRAGEDTRVWADVCAITTDHPGEVDNKPMLKRAFDAFWQHMGKYSTRVPAQAYAEYFSEIVIDCWTSDRD